MFNLEEILEQKYPDSVKFKANESIFKDGDSILGVFYIKKGKVKVSGCGKNNVAMWFANPKELIGLSSFFNNCEFYSFNASSFGEDVELILIPKEDFERLLDEYPKFKQEIIHILCERISFTRKRISSIKSQNVKKRFLNTLLLFIKAEDLKEGTAKIRYSILEFSELTGTSRQYIHKLIKEFQDKKLLELCGKKMMKINMSELYSNMIGTKI